MTQTTTPMTTHLYDVLDVDPSASPDEIRLAWRSAVADLDPTDRRFRVYNQAAEVLLDPVRRATYDAELAEAESDQADPTVEAESAELPRSSRARALRSRSGRNVLARGGVPGWLLLAVAGVTAVLLGFVGVALTQPSDSSVRADTDAAQAAAEAAVVPILSYDYRNLDASAARATATMTSSQRADYEKFFSVIRGNAPHTGTVVRAQYVASGVVRSGTDRVDVLVFVNQRTTNKQHPDAPVVYKSQVTMTMAKVGGSWLVDGLSTNADHS
jgi:Mce-associated membrane protein